MLVRRITATIHDGACFGQGRRLGQLVVGAVEVGDIGGDHLALEVLPRPGADPVLGVHPFGAEIGFPGLAGRAGGFRQLGAMGICPVEAAEIGAISDTDAGDEEGHGGRVLRNGRCSNGEGRRGGCGDNDRFHWHLPVRPEWAATGEHATPVFRPALAAI